MLNLCDVLLLLIVLLGHQLSHARLEAGDLDASLLQIALQFSNAALRRTPPLVCFLEFGLQPAHPVVGRVQLNVLAGERCFQLAATA